MNWILNSELFY